MYMHRPSIIAVVAILAASACVAPSRPPQFIGGVDLVYPEAAKASGIEGRVVVRYDVTADGSVVNAVVEASEPPGMFDEAALTAVRSWRFRPRVDRGEVVAAPGRVSELLFRLGESEYDDLFRPGDAAPDG